MAEILNFSELVDQITKLFQLITQNDAGSVLSALSFFILVFAFLGFRKVATAEPQQTTKLLVSLTVCAFVFGIILAAAGPTVTLLQLKTGPIVKTPKEISIAHLRDNKEVRWLIRLIAYDPNTESGKQLAIGHIQRLGPPTVEYTFVASYEELKGYSAGKALFGARIFFIKNLPLDGLGNRYLIDFGSQDQLIPEIGVSKSSTFE